MALKVARRGAVPPFIAMEVLRDANERAARGENILHLEVGQPSTSAPRGVIEAAKCALDRDQLGYRGALAPAAATRIPPSRLYCQRRSPRGVHHGLSRYLAAFDPGDRVALAAPGYPAYRNILVALGITPVNLPTDAETRFQPTPELLDRIEGRIDGLIVASPSNPAGTMIDADSLRRLYDHCRARQVRLVSDEIYHGITYGMKPTTALALGDDAIVINSFSKYFSMTGWRIGWMIAPTDLLRPIECLAQNLFISPPTLPQIAASAAFAAGTNSKPMSVAMREPRASAPAAPCAGLTASPRRALYIYADVRG